MDNADMPACDARYDVTLSDGSATWNGFGRPSTNAVLDFLEERLPDDFGDPGAHVTAMLERYWSNTGRRIRYGPLGIRNRMVLWVDEHSCHTQARHRRYLRWRWAEPDPPPHDDPEWITTP